MLLVLPQVLLTLALRAATFPPLPPAATPYRYVLRSCEPRPGPAWWRLGFDDRLEVAWACLADRR